MKSANSISRLIGKMFTRSTEHRAIRYDGFYVTTRDNIITVSYQDWNPVVQMGRISSISGYLKHNGVQHEVSEHGTYITIL